MRILPYWDNMGLYTNIIRYHNDIPLYRKLNPLEIQTLVKRFGSADKFPKLSKASTVCQYYGFRTGDIVLPLRCMKDFNRTVSNVILHMNEIISYIDELRPCIVINPLIG